MAVSGMVNLSSLLDQAKCFELVFRDNQNPTFVLPHSRMLLKASSIASPGRSLTGSIAHPCIPYRRDHQTGLCRHADPPHAQPHNLRPLGSISDEATGFRREHFRQGNASWAF